MLILLVTFLNLIFLSSYFRMADHQDYTDNRVQIKTIREGDYLLIDLVKHNSHLYNKELKDFKDIEKREQTWHEIAGSLNISGKGNLIILFKLKKSSLFLTLINNFFAFLFNILYYF